MSSDRPNVIEPRDIWPVLSEDGLGIFILFYLENRFTASASLQAQFKATDAREKAANPEHDWQPISPHGLAQAESALVGRTVV